MNRRILEAVVDELRSRSDGDGIDARIDRITVGDAAVMVELEWAGDRRTRAGLAYRPPHPVPRLPTDVDGLVAAALQPVKGLSGAVRRAISIAGLNALSAPYVGWIPGDPMALLEEDVSTVATVGLFRPAFGRFSDVEVRVIERRANPPPPEPEELPPDVRVSMYGPDAAVTALSGAEVVFVTGSTLAYGGIEQYLDAIEESATTVLIGSTASFLAEPAFEAGIDVVAGASVADVDAARAAVRSGACGSGLHDAGVRKGYVTTGRPAGIATDRDVTNHTRSYQ
ncbi:Rossmann-like domain-containing protein [Natrialbaceae archaeon GCM10025810]|uniref:Rossmann-like domain-containing protein n=1 Tax=Halovalidus salilacus TaxID=3075124 RepID=UPI00360DDBB2